MTFRLGQPIVRWGDDQVALLQELAAHPDKLSAGQIADKMGWPTRNAVIGMCKRRGIKLQQKARSGGDPTKPRKPRGKARSKTNTKFNFDKPTFRKEPFKTRAVKCEPLHLSLMAKTDSQCAYPYGEAAPFTFCCLPVVGGYSYCQAHKELCLVKPIRPAKPFIAQRGRAA